MTKGVRFLTSFFFLSAILYGFNIAYIGLTSPEGLYLPWLDEHFNYIKIWRNCYITIVAKTLKLFGYTVYTSDISLKVQGHSGFRLVYSCLGYGVISCFSAFVLSFPKTLGSRLVFLFTGLITIILLNLFRFLAISLFYDPQLTILSANHHDIFNGFLYTILLIMMNKWAKD